MWGVLVLWGVVITVLLRTNLTLTKFIFGSVATGLAVAGGVWLRKLRRPAYVFTNDGGEMHHQVL